MGKRRKHPALLRRIGPQIGADHCKSILKAFSDSSSESDKVGDEADAKILVYTIFFHCFMIRNELFGLVQDGQKANRLVESILFRSLDRAFADGGMTELTLHGMEFIDHLAGAKDLVDPPGSTLFSDIPPRNLFPKPGPPNLITVPCCYECNNALALDDEAMRAFLSAGAGRSAAGDTIWREKVVESSFRRSPKLRAAFAKSIVPVLAEKRGIVFPARAVTFPDERADRYLIRITKGLLYHFYPGFDYSNHIFRVDHIQPSQDNVAMLYAKFVHEKRGNGVFRCFRQVITDQPSGVWVHVFYDWACFLVTHGSPETAVAQIEYVWPF